MAQVVLIYVPSGDANVDPAQFPPGARYAIRHLAEPLASDDELRAAVHLLMTTQRMIDQRALVLATRKDG